MTERLHSERLCQERIPFGRWVLLSAVAVGGSLFFGASIAWGIKGWELWKGALWLTLSAGTGWFLLAPGLIYLTRLHPYKVIDACLVTMAVGEVVLCLGATVTFARGSAVDSTTMSWLAVALSNFAMAGVLDGQLRRYAVPTAKTLGAWIVLLDGGGAVAFWVLHRVIFG